MMDWDERGFLAAASAAIGAAEEDCAEMVEQTARSYLSRAKGHGDDAPHLADALKAVKSKFPQGGYIVGVFDSSPPAKWEDSVGARAVFYEYGHAAPYAGRGNVKRANIQKATTPKPFLKAALKKRMAAIRRAIQDHLR
jgi:hypothetical protein